MLCCATYRRHFVFTNAFGDVSGCLRGTDRLDISMQVGMQDLRRKSKVSNARPTPVAASCDVTLHFRQALGCLLTTYFFYQDDKAKAHVI
jgi:hypothetical protein